jgi:hypothetical protein
MRGLFVAYLVLLSCGAAIAQFAMGLTAGVNYGGPIGKIEGTGKPIPGLIGGAVFNYKLSPKWNVAAMLLYSFRGAEYQQASTNDSTVYVTVGQNQVPVTTNYTANINGTLRLHYIDMPLLASYYIAKRGTIDFGPQFSYLVGGSDKGTNDIVFVENGIFNQKVQYNNIDELNRFDYGVTLGGTYYTKFGLNVGLRASRGFRSDYRKGFFSSRGFTETGLYNTFVHLTLGYTFGNHASAN